MTKRQRESRSHPEQKKAPHVSTPKRFSSIFTNYDNFLSNFFTSKRRRELPEASEAPLSMRNDLIHTPWCQGHLRSRLHHLHMKGAFSFQKLRIFMILNSKKGQKSVFTPTSEAPGGAFSCSRPLQSSEWLRYVPRSPQNLLACSYLV